MDPDSLQSKHLEPVDYENKIGNKIVFLRETCHCRSSKREHIFTKRVKRFCFCCSDVSWYGGLTSVAVITLIFGILQFIVYYVLVLRGSPSYVNSYILFPNYACFLYFELFFNLYTAIRLWISVYRGDLKVIKNFPWLLLLNYVFAVFHIFEILFYGHHITISLLLTDYGMLIKDKDPEKDEALLHEELIFYILSGLAVIFGLCFWTYIIILSLTWIDRLKDAIEDDEI